MLILALDAATATCGVALAEGERVLVEYAERVGRNHAARLLPLAEAALAAAGCGRSELAAVAVTVGPGSYTGVRIGLATAKALAYGLRLPAVGVSTLEALAFGAGPRPGLVCPVLDARRGRVYAALYRWQGERLVEVEPPRLAESGSWFASLAGRAVHLTGDGLAVHGDAAAALGATGAVSFAHSLEAALRPGAVAILGARRLQAGGGVGPDELLPLYLGGQPPGAARPGGGPGGPGGEGGPGEGS